MVTVTVGPFPGQRRHSVAAKFKLSASVDPTLATVGFGLLGEHH